MSESQTLVGHAKAVTCLEVPSLPSNPHRPPQLRSGVLLSSGDDGYVIQWKLAGKLPAMDAAPDVAGGNSALALRDAIRAAAAAVVTPATPSKGREGRRKVVDLGEGGGLTLKMSDIEDVEGWLWKQGQMLKRWTRRYFVVKEAVLSAFVDDDIVREGVVR